MMTIERYPADILRRQCSLVVEPKDVGNIAYEMIDTMRSADGVGLAAPQVGLPLRFFVTSVAHDRPRVFINPEITDRSRATWRYEESCLSLPGVYAYVIRPRRVTVRAFDQKGQPVVLEAKGLLARVIQHELDHLNGVLFVDHLNPKRCKRILTDFESRIAAGRSAK